MRSSSAKTGSCTRAIARAHCFDFVRQSLFFSSFCSFILFYFILFDVVYVSFVVNSNGAIDQIEILRSPSTGFNEEVIRVVKKMPNWKAGIQGGQKVPVRFKMPVRFSLKK